MGVKIVTHWSTLIEKAKEVGRARSSGDPERLRKASADLKAYEELVLMSDETIL